MDSKVLTAKVISQETAKGLLDACKYAKAVFSGGYSGEYGLALHKLTEVIAKAEAK